MGEETSPTVEEDGWEDILGSGDLLRKVVQPSDPNADKPEKDDMVTVSVIGKLEDGTEVEPKKIITFWLGNYDVDQALDMVVQLMHVWERDLIKTKARFTYGSCEKSSAIPSDSVLIYEVELLKVEDPPTIIDFTPTQLISFSNERKDRGNQLYSKSYHEDAIAVYKKTIKILDEYVEAKEKLEKDEKSLISTQIALLANNLAASQLKTRKLEDALESLERCLKVDENNVKALFRKAKVYKERNEVALAIAVLRKAKEADPESQMIEQELLILSNKQRKEVSKEKMLYKKMFKGIKDVKQAPIWQRVVRDHKWSLMAAFIVIVAIWSFYAFFSPN